MRAYEVNEITVREEKYEWRQTPHPRNKGVDKEEDT